MNRKKQTGMIHMKKHKAIKQLSRKRNFADYKTTYPPYLHILFSIPEGATPVQACDVVDKWLDEHPEEWNKPGYQLLIKALKTAC
jgi:hypothetical protein